MKLGLITLAEGFSVAHLAATDPIPKWVPSKGFTSITRTSDELSIVCEAQYVPTNVRAERDWRAFKIQGPISFEAIGVLNSVSVPLAEAGISVFVVSTFDTDYILVKERNFHNAKQVIGKHHKLSSSD